MTPSKDSSRIPFSAFLIVSLFLHVTCFSQGLPCYVPENDLIAFYPFNGDALDYSGNNHHPTFVSASLTTDQDGTPNRAYFFNGHSNYMLVPDHFDLRLGNTDYSIAFWATVHPNANQVVTQVTKRCNISQQGYTVGSHNVVTRFGIVVSHSCDPRVFSNTVMPRGTWFHVVITYSVSDQRVKIYKNGQIDHTSTGIDCNGNPTNGMPNPGITCNVDMRIGMDTRLNSYHHWGKMDDVGIWGREITPQEVLDLYERGGENVALQPVDQHLIEDDTAIFTTQGIDPNSTYQWQTNLGTGFVNLHNAGQYDGVTTPMLYVYNVTLNNNNQVFRCLVDGNCPDVTNDARLYVEKKISDPEDPDPDPETTRQRVRLLVFPSPTEDFLTIEAINIICYDYDIYDSAGRRIMKGLIEGEETTVDVSHLAAGMYWMRLNCGDTKIAKFVKYTLF